MYIYTYNIHVYISTLPNPPCVKELAFGPSPSVLKNRQEQQGSSRLTRQKGPKNRKYPC